MEHKITLKASGSASRRTKNKLNEHQGQFLFHKQELCQGVMSILVEHPVDGWYGWIPATEVVITNVE